MRPIPLILFSLLLSLASMKSWADELCGGRGNCCNVLSGNSCGAPSYVGPRIALVVGTDSYGSLLAPLGITPLDNAVNDATYIGDQLASIGFSVRYLLEPDKKIFKNEVVDFANAVGRISNDMRNDPIAERDKQLAMIYVAGHGFSVEAGGAVLGENIVLRERDYGIPPTNACNLFKDSTTTVRFLRSKLSQHGDFPTVFLIDACRSLPSSLPACFSEGDTRGSTMDASRLDGEFSIRWHSTQYSTSALQPAQDTSPVDGLGAYASQIGPLISVPELNLAHIINLSRRLVPAVTPNYQTPSPVHNFEEQTRRVLVSPRADAPCEASESRLWLSMLRCTSFDPGCEEERICPAYFEERASNDAATCGYSRFEGVINSAAGRDSGHTLSEICRAFETRTAAAADASFTFRNTQDSSFRELLVTTGYPIGNLPVDSLTAFAQTADRTATASSLEQNDNILGIRLSGTRTTASRLSLPSTATWPNPISTTSALVRPIPRPGGRSIEYLSSVQQRELLLRQEFQPDVGSPVNATADFRLYVSPNTSSGQVFLPESLSEDTILREDCVNIACGSGWIGVTAFDGQEYIRGFARPEAISEIEPIENVHFIRNNWKPLGSTEREQLDALVRKAIDANGFVQIVLFVVAKEGETINSESTGSLTALDRLALSALETHVLGVELDGEKIRAANLAQQTIILGNGVRHFFVSLRVP